MTCAGGISNKLRNGPDAVRREHGGAVGAVSRLLGDFRVGVGGKAYKGKHRNGSFRSVALGASDNPDYYIGELV